MFKGIIFGIIILMILILCAVVITLLIHLLSIPAIFTPKKIIAEIISKIGVNKEFIFMELGAGDARVSREALKHSAKEVIIYEVSPFFIIFSKLRLTLTKLFDKRARKSKITIFSQNLYSAELTRAVAVYLHLNPKAMARLEKRAVCAIDEGVGLYSYKYEFPNLKPQRVDELSNGEKLFVYKD